VRIKIQKSLSRGEYFVSFQTAGFSEEETEKINKFGSPNIDFSSDGLGEQNVEGLDISLKFDTQEQAEETVARIQNLIREKMDELRGKVDTFSGEEVIEL
jgi:hypothetical protein